MAGGRRRLGLAGRLTIGLLAVAAVGMVVMALYVTRALETSWVEQLKSSLVTEAQLVGGDALALLAGAAPAEQVQALADRYGRMLRARVTVIRVDGAVLGDSERDLAGVRRMENHAARPEVRAALAGGVGSDVRRSRTLGLEMLYVATPLVDGGRVHGVLRLALPLTEVARTSASIRRTVVGGAVLALAAALGVGLFISRRVTRPVRQMQRIAHRMAEGDFGRPAPTDGRDEIAELGRTLNVMAASLREKIQTLERQRAEVAAILEGMVEGVVALDDRGRVLLMNPAARAIFGLPAGPVEGRALLEVVRQRALFDLVEACRAAGSGTPYRREVELGPPLGRVLAAHAVPVAFAPSGAGTVIVLHDVTELRRLERVRTEFVANVSHELRTPLTAIRGYVETLLDGALDEPDNARRFLGTVRAHAERLGRLVDDLLELSNAETGKVVLRLEPLALRDVTAGIAATFERQAAGKGVELLDQVPPGLAVRADRDRLAQILVNLVDNAVKYTPAGGHVTLGAAGGARGVVELSVADTGIGIPSVDLPRISERFYRVDKARSRELGGTGLGLAIVKHLVQAHGGELRIESELGKGTTVRLTLPAA